MEFGKVFQKPMLLLPDLHAVFGFSLKVLDVYESNVLCLESIRYAATSIRFPIHCYVSSILNQF
jgi:hypothetical protein